MHHLSVTLKAFNPDLAERFPKEFAHLQAYMDDAFAHAAFKETQYPVETVLWGWNNARKA